jgi:hypothetical protein
MQVLFDCPQRDLLQKEVKTNLITTKTKKNWNKSKEEKIEGKVRQESEIIITATSRTFDSIKCHSNINILAS